MVKLFLKFSIGSWLSAAISLFTTPIITALIIPEEFGKASMYTLAFNLITQLALIGTDMGFARKFYQEDTDEHRSTVLFNSILIPLLLSFLVAFIVFLAGNKIGPLLINTTSVQFNLLLSCSVIFAVLERFAMLVLRMNKKAVAFSSIRVLFSVINFLVVFLYAKLVHKDFYAIIYGNFIGLIICISVAIFLERSVWKFQKINKGLMKSILIYGLPFLPTFVVTWLFEGIDKMALRYYSDFNEIGLFSAAYKIIALLAIVQTAFSNFWVPVSLEMYEKNSGEAKEMFSKVLGYMCAALFICAIGMILCKDIIILFFAGPYRSASSIMPFLLLVPLMYVLSEVTVGGINYKNKTYWHLFIAVIAALVNYGLNLILVPQFGAKGAAVSTGISYCVFFYSRTYVSNYLFPLTINFIKLHSSMFLFMLVAFFNTFYPNEIFTYILTVATMLALVLLYKTELLFFKKTVGKKLGWSLAPKNT